MNKLYTRLMFPEPEATGGGVSDAPVQTEAEENPFDSISFETEGEDSNAQVEPGSDETSEYSLNFDESLELEPEEVEIFAQAAREVGLDSDTATGMFSNIAKAINENNARVKKEEEAKALDDLRKRWGGSFKANAAQAGRFIAKVGKQIGWKPEVMAAFKTPYHMELFYDISRAMGGSLSLGAANAKPVQRKLTAEEMRNEQKTITDKFWEARNNGNREEAEKLREQHAEYMEKLTGKRVYILRL